MPKKKIIFIFLFLFIFICLEMYFNKSMQASFKNISSSIFDVRENSIIEKETELSNNYGFDDYLDYHVEYSKVLFRDIYHMSRTITIYKGSNNRIQNNNLVVNQDGLIGIVTEVLENSSVVELLYNENTSLSVQVNNFYGILECQNQKLIIEGIHNKADIKVGDLVTTSDISIYPEGILIGEVSEITYDKYEIEQVLTITPFVDFDSIKYLGIITDLRGVE